MYIEASRDLHLCASQIYVCVYVCWYKYTPTYRSVLWVPSMSSLVIYNFNLYNLYLILLQTQSLSRRKCICEHLDLRATLPGHKYLLQLGVLCA